jgi:hypothetical protein
VSARRLVALAAAAPADARETAREVLRERRFHEPPVPRPFKGPLHWLGGLLEDLAGALAGLVGARDGVGWVLLGALVVLAVSVLASREIRRRAQRMARTAAGSAGDADADQRPRADELERGADVAERAGDAAAAVRLRFRAGLLRLDEADVISWRPSLTTREVRRQVRSPRLDGLSATFDAVAYGGRPATAHDAAAARTDWDALLAEVRGRR